MLPLDWVNYTTCVCMYIYIYIHIIVWCNSTDGKSGSPINSSHIQPAPTAQCLWAVDTPRSFSAGPGIVPDWTSHRSGWNRRVLKRSLPKEKTSEELGVVNSTWWHYDLWVSAAVAVMPWVKLSRPVLPDKGWSSALSTCHGDHHPWSP